MASPVHYTERLSTENIHHLVFLFREVFRKKIALDYIRAKYDTRWLGKSHYGYLAFDKAGLPIAFHGCVPFRVAYKDIVELGAQFGDAMTLKEHNGKGIFTLLGRMTEELLAAEGINFSYGLPNQNSEHGYIHKLKWTSTERLVRFQVPAGTFPYEKFLRRSGFEALYQERVLNVIRPLLSEERLLPNSMIDAEHAGVLRDEAFFRYKSFTPNHVIELDGVKVWMKAQGIFLVGDIGAQDEKTILGTVEKLRQLSARLGINKLVLQYHPGTPQEKALSRHFPSYPSWPVCYNAYNTKIPLDKLRFNYGDLDTF